MLQSESYLIYLGGILWIIIIYVAVSIINFSWLGITCTIAYTDEWIMNQPPGSIGLEPVLYHFTDYPFILSKTTLKFLY